MSKIRTTLILIGLLAVFVPVCVSAGNVDREGTKSLLTGTAVHGGDIYVMGTYDSNRLWVNKYSKDDLDTPVATWTLQEGADVQYWAGSDAYNGAITVDDNGNVYVGAVRGTGDSRQMMVYRLDPDLKGAASKCFGTTTTDNPGGTYKNPEVRSIAVSGSGNIYVAGDLNKTEKKGLDEWGEPVCSFDMFKKNQSADQEAGRRIGYVVRLDDGLQFQKCTYMGCGSDGNAAIVKLMCDEDELYMIGKDASGNIPTTDGVIQREINRTSSYSDSFDAFIMRMDGETLESKVATYYGGTGSEEVADMKLVGQNLYVYGDTTSDDLPLSEGAYSTQRASSSGFYPGAYVLRLHKTMKRTDSFAATYFGDAKSNRIDAFSMDAAGGRVYLTGKTGLASSIPVTDGSTKGHIFIASMSGDLSALHSATVMGSGGAGDYGRGIVRLGDQIYLSGTWGSDAMIDTKTLQPFIMKIKDGFAHAALSWIGMKTFVNDVQNYGTGQTIEIKLTFDSNVEVTGSPRLKLNIQNGEDQFREAEYATGSGSKNLIFTYTVREGDTTGGNRLTTYGDEPFDLSEGNISPWASTEGERADLTMPAGSDNRLEYAAGDRVYVDGKPAESGEEEDDQGKTDDKPSVTPAKDINAITPADATADSAKVSKSIPKVSSSTLTTTASIAKRKMTLKWAAVKGATNYRIAYKTAKATKWNYKWSAGKSSAVFTKLSSKGLYQYRVAAYKKIEGTWYRSEYTGIQYRYIASTSKITAKAKGKKKVKVTWKKQKGASGYQVIYSLKKNMKGAKIKNVKGGAKKTVTLKKLKKGKRYYVQVRPYKTYKGKKYIGAVSGRKAVRVK